MYDQIPLFHGFCYFYVCVFCDIKNLDTKIRRKENEGLRRADAKK
jgi:hypothetical protein